MFFFYEYSQLLIYSIISGLLGCIIFFLSYTLTIKSDSIEKLSAYECGFDPFDDARSQFDVRFYLVAILFLIFDLEASFLFPWSLAISNLTSLGFWSIIDFIFELAIGFFYAWRLRSLDWLYIILFFGEMAEWFKAIVC